MSQPEPTILLPKDFTGTVRLFPLPNLVMFPHVVQPLHIFEPRYCELLQDALATDGLIAMVLLEPGWEGDYEGRPALAPVACLGRIIAHEPLAGGRHNILLRGLCRAAIRRECPLVRAYRQAEVDLLEDHYSSAGAGQRSQLKKRLVEYARQVLERQAATQDQLDEILDSEVSLGTLTDVFAHTLGFASAVKQRLLAEWRVDQRAAYLAEKLAAITHRLTQPDGGDEAPFPPRFSLN